MAVLVEQLKNEHSIIAETLGKVEKLGIGSKEGQDILCAAKNGLLAHLKNEDENLYPVLNKAAETDADLRRTLDMFARDMGVISTGALEFFGKYSDGGSGIEFAKDFGKLFATLSHRIRKEEDIIYEKYDELKK